jgi:hypothetical protein
VRKATPSVRCNHYETGIEARSEYGKNVPRVALFQRTLDGDTAIANARDLGVQCFLSVIRQACGCVSIDHERRIRKSDDGEVEDVRHDDASAERVREIDGPIERGSSQIAEVGTDEDDSL